MLFAGLFLAGCAISTPLGPIFGSADDTVTATGSIPGQDIRLNAAMTDADWQQVRQALQAALDPANPGAAFVWTNQAGGTRGSITPVAESFTQDNLHCRSFVAALTGAGTTQWYQGKGCQKPKGTGWSILKVQPWALPPT